MSPWLVVLLYILVIGIFAGVPIIMELRSDKKIKETNVSKVLDLSAKGICDQCGIGKENCIAKGYPICQQYKEEDNEK
jgi:hypothetical protein